jgi:hypothetical protein
MQVLDLEGIAKHRGSAFGNFGTGTGTGTGRERDHHHQPTNTQFRNNLAMAW